MLRGNVSALVLLVVGTASVVAGPIEDRKALMKQNAEAAKIGVGLAKGDLPYDQAKAEDILKVHTTVASKLPTLFPEDSQTGSMTSAAPKIWEDMPGFKAAAAEFGQPASAAVAATTETPFGVGSVPAGFACMGAAVPVPLPLPAAAGCAGITGIGRAVAGRPVPLASASETAWAVPVAGAVALVPPAGTLSAAVPCAVAAAGTESAHCWASVRSAFM